MRKNKKTFTLIEMVVVVTIIGVLATSMAPKLQDTQGRARDTKRKADMSQIRNALEVYFNDYGQTYPITTTTPTNYFQHSAYQPTDWVPSLVPNYLRILPIDPINNFIGPANQNFTFGNSTTYPGQFEYVYYYFGPTGNTVYNGQGTYIMYTVLENHMDPDRCETKQYTTTYRSGKRWRCSGTGSNRKYAYIASIGAGADN